MIYVVALFEDYEGHEAPCAAFHDKEDAIKWCESQGFKRRSRSSEAGYYVYAVPVHPEPAAVGWGTDRQVWPKVEPE